MQTSHGSNFAAIHSNKPYAAIQLLGGYAGRGHAAYIPAWPYIPIDPDSEEISRQGRDTVLDVLEHHLNRMIDA